MAPIMVKRGERERNGNGEVLKDPRDSQRKIELIMSSSILIDNYDRCDEVRRKNPPSRKEENEHAAQ